MALLLASLVEGVVVELLAFGLEIGAITFCLCLFVNSDGLDGLLEGPGRFELLELVGSLLLFCAGLTPVGGMPCEFLGMVLGLVFSGVFWFLWVGVFLGDGRSIVGGMVWSLMELMGSGLNRTIPVGGEFSCFLGALGGDGGLVGGGDLVGDGDGDLTGESEKGFLMKEDLADDLCRDWDFDGGGRLD